MEYPLDIKDFLNLKNGLNLIQILLEKYTHWEDRYLDLQEGNFTVSK